MNIENVIAPNFVANLTSSFEEWLRLDVANRSTDFGDDYVWCWSLVSLQAHASFNFICDVRNYLHGVAEIFSATFTLNNR